MSTSNDPEEYEDAGTAGSGDSPEGANRREEQRLAAVAEAPYVAVSLQTSGIHPSTSRIVGIDAVTFDDEGEIFEVLHAVVDPGEDPGPVHLHGLTHEEVAEGQRFSQVLKALDRFIDDRTLVVHNAPRTWGFLVAEARRTMNAAARSNRSRGRGRGRRRRQRVGHVPRPVAIVDTLATARRQGVPLKDTRLAGVAAALGLSAPSPVATVERAMRPEQEISRETTLLLVDVMLTESDRGELASREPGDLRGDRFGLQRSHVRVDAVDAPRPLENPGTYTPGRSLIRGMEIVVAPEIEMDPNDIIEACLREELAYSEKLTRQTSVVVCNETTGLRGKAMHAVRKGIPLLSDVAFMEAVSRVKDPTAS